MSLFKKKESKPLFSVCVECGVHFEPVSELATLEYQWRHLCSTHRKPFIERHLRVKKVTDWAEANWEKLEPMMKKDEKKKQKDKQPTATVTWSGCGVQAMNTEQTPLFGLQPYPYGGIFRTP